jgi:hypothetical protein
VKATALIDGLAATRNQASGALKRGLVRGSLLFLGILSAYGLLALGQLFVSWAYDYWEYYDTNVGFIPAVIGGLLLLVGIIVAMVRGFIRLRYMSAPPGRFKQRQEAATRAKQALLAALSEPHDALMPPIPYEPLSVAVTAKRQRVGPLYNVTSFPSNAKLWGLLITIPSQLFVLLGNSPFSVETILNGNAQTEAGYLAAAHQSETISSALLFFALVSLILIIPGLLMQIATVGRQFYANDAGLWWRNFAKWQHLPWAEIQSIGTYYPEQDDNLGAVRYVIAGKEALLTWQVKPLKPGLTATPALRDMAATNQLISLALTQTGLPIRDLTPLTDALAHQTELALDPAAVATSGAANQEGAEHAILALFTAQPEPPAQQLSWQATVALVVLAVIVCFGPFATVRVVHDTLLPRYLTSLPSMIQPRTPLLADPLTHNDGKWPTQLPTKADGDAIGYTAQGYAITNGGDTGQALLVGQYHAVAIQATVRFSSSIPSDGQSGAGIVYRQRAERDDDCTFIVDTNGNWENTCSYVSFQHSNALHTGKNAVNTLLVLARGQSYTFYLNGQAVGYDFDSFMEPFGQIGLVNLIPGVTATFTDFTVWSIKAPPSLSYV